MGITVEELVDEFRSELNKARQKNVGVDLLFEVKMFRGGVRKAEVTVSNPLEDNNKR